MSYRGKLRGGVVVLEPDVQLPDGLDVIVQPVQPEQEQQALPRSPQVMRNGVPVFPRSGGNGAPGLDLVNQLRDETL
jgi:hypothetical protein